MYGGAHIRDRHEVQDGGKTVYAGETIYSADGPDLVFTYVNSLGGVGQGKVGSAGSLLGFTGTMRASPNKSEEPIDAEWRSWTRTITRYDRSSNRLRARRRPFSNSRE